MSTFFFCENRQAYSQILKVEGVFEFPLALKLARKALHLCTYLRRAKAIFNAIACGTVTTLHARTSFIV